MAPGCPSSSDNFRALGKGSGVRELQIQVTSLEGALTLLSISATIMLLHLSC